VKTRILVADDEECNLDLFRVVLGHNGEVTSDDLALAEQEQALFGGSAPPGDDVGVAIELECCHQAAEAVNAVRTSLMQGSPFMAAFLDVRMPPGQNGVRAAERIRAIDPDILIVFLTAFSDIPPEEMVRAVPPADQLLYLKKPIQPEQLKELTQSLVSRYCAKMDPANETGMGSGTLWEVYRSLVCQRLWHRRQ
jgi:CheY-like chemotaxis protein